MPAAHRLRRRSAVVLAGGRSRRMGRPKALLDLGGEPLLRRVARTLLAHAPDLVVVAAASGSRDEAEIAAIEAAVSGLVPGRDAGGVRLVRDGAPDLGPVAGFAAGLAAARGACAFVAACDAPFLAPRLIEGFFAMAEADPGADVVIARTAGGLEPMVAVHRVATMAACYARQLADGDLRPTSRFASLRVREVGGEELADLDPAGVTFLGVNDPAEYAAALAYLGSRRG